MRLSSWVILGLVTWLAAELLALGFVISVAGVAGAVLLGLLTSVVGVNLLRRRGFEAVRHLQRTVSGQARPVEGTPEQAVADGLLAAFGAVLLILPGFLSDLVGLGLAAPAFRQWLLSRFGIKPGGLIFSRGPRRSGEILDLAEADWHRVDEPTPPPRGGGLQRG